MLATVLPHLTAALNAAAAILILTGYTLIRTGHRVAHRRVMTSAVVVSAVFLACYLLHHFTQPRLFAFPGVGLIRPVYFAMLFSHIALALVVTPMIIVTFVRARRGIFDRHKALARWTFPIWLYVSVTGVLIYVLLYQVYGYTT